MKTPIEQVTEGNKSVTRWVSYSRQDFLPLFELRKIEEFLKITGWVKVAGVEPEIVHDHETEDIGYIKVKDVWRFEDAGRTWYAQNCAVNARFGPWSEQKSYEDRITNYLDLEKYLVSSADFYVTGRDDSVKKVIRTLDAVVQDITRIKMGGERRR